MTILIMKLKQMIWATLINSIKLLMI